MRGTGTILALAAAAIAGTASARQPGTLDVGTHIYSPTPVISHGGSGTKPRGLQSPGRRDSARNPRNPAPRPVAEPVGQG